MKIFNKLDKDKLWFYAFLGIPFIILFIITIGPLCYSVGTSFFKWNLAIPGSRKFIGLENYFKMVSNPEFWNAIFNTFYMVFTTVILQLFLGMFSALLLRRDIKGIRILRSLYLLPMMTTPVVIGLTWAILFNTEIGLINYFLSLIGISSINWLGSTTFAMPSLIITSLWRATPFVTMIFIAGLQSLPEDVYESAMVEGANSLQAFRYITLPLMKPFIWLAILFRTMDAIRRFDTIFVMTGGGPGNSTETLNLHAYFHAFKYLNLGYGAGLASLMLVIILLLSLFVIRRIK